MGANRISFDYPSNTPIVDPKNGVATNPWQMWFSRVNSIIATGQQSGTTAQRPTTQVWIGRQFYDTTLNKPVYVSAVNPVVWRDAASTIC
jgi:hypothetical protein